MDRFNCPVISLFQDLWHMNILLQILIIKYGRNKLFQTDSKYFKHTQRHKREQTFDQLQFSLTCSQKTEQVSRWNS